MTDRYTKSVLTVIAVALMLIAAQLGIPMATAQFGDGCGDSRGNPCWVKGSVDVSGYVGIDGAVEVQTSTWPIDVRVK